MLALVGWLSGMRFLAGQWATYVPMSPSTVLVFLLLTGGLFCVTRWHSQRKSRIFALTAGSVAFLLALMVLAQIVTGVDPGVEQLLSGTNELMGSTPLGRMSPVTALSFLLESSALLLLIARRWSHAATWAALLAAGAVGINAVVLVGYVYGVPLLYGGTIIPVALPTAIAFLLVGIGQWYRAVPDVPALRHWRGASMRGILLRAFLPLILIFVVVQGWLDLTVQHDLALNPALWQSIVALTAGALIIVITGWIAKRTGGEIERAQAALVESETKVRNFFENSPIGNSLTGVDGSLRVNKAFCEMVGYSEEELTATKWKEITYPDDVQKGLDVVQSLLDGKVSSGHFQKRYMHKNGNLVWTDVVTALQTDANGDPLYFLTAISDLTERKQAEDELITSQERYRDLIENALDIIYTHDLEGNYIIANTAVEHILGYTIEEALTKNMMTLVTPEYLEKARQIVADLRAGRKAPVTDLEVFAKDGHRVTIEVNAKLIEENGVPVGIQGVARDISDRKQLEDQLRQSSKLEAVGQLAGGIAHDFNNLLTAITGYSQLSIRKLPADDPIRTNIEEIAKAGERAAELTRQLLVFSRKQMLVPIVHNLNSVITEIEKMLRRLIRENIELRTILDPELGNIRADPGQIEQVIVNLAVNARDAMPAGGTVTIETQNAYFDEDYASQHLTVSRGPFVKLIVTDTGEGMDEKTQRRIFEPFFTTKAVGKGTGLGLSTVYGIVKQSGGNIMVYSEIGHGTTFKIYLPRVDEIVQIPKWIEDGEEIFSGTETILVVEDEEVVRDLVREILTTNGYNVLKAATGEEALAICGTYLKPIHLLLTDVIMPGLSGPASKDQIVKLLPDIKVLFMSGYTDDSIASTGLLESDAAFIEKPFTPDGLARKVREVLES